MKASLLYTTVIFVSAATAQTLDQIQKLESSGDTLSARTALSRATQTSPKDIAAWTAYAEFLDRYGDPAARDRSAVAEDLREGYISRAAAMRSYGYRDDRTEGS